MSIQIPGNTSTQYNLTAGDTVTATLDFYGDVDWWRVNLQSGFGYQVWLRGSSYGNGTLTDPFLKVYNSQGFFVTFSDDVELLNPYIYLGWPTVYSGTYYLSAEGLQSGVGSYMLTVWRDQVSDTSTAAVLVPDSATTDRVGYQNDTSDWYSIFLQAGRLYEFDLVGSTSQNPLRALTDGAIRIRNLFGSIITQDDDSGTSLNAKVFFTPTTSGTYYVDVDPTGLDFGVYSLIVNESPIVANPGIGSSAFRSIDFSGEIEIFEFQLTAGSTYRFSALGTTLSNPLVELLTDTGQVIEMIDVGPNNQLTITPVTSGTYYASVRSYNYSNIGNYTFYSERLNATSSPPSGTVTILGITRQGEALTATNSLTDPDGIPTTGPGALRYDWRADGLVIPGATSSSYILTQSDVGKMISVRASYTDNRGNDEEVFSAQTAAVINLNDSPTGDVTISGSPRVGQTLTASNNLSDLDGIPQTGSGSITYQWKSEGLIINGATSSTYTPTQNDAGKRISVTASYVDGFGTVEHVNSNPTSPVSSSDTLHQGVVYHWRSHTLLSGVEISSVSTHALNPDNGLIDLRAALFDEDNGTLTLEVWSTPSTASGSFDFSVNTSNAVSASFASSLSSNWSILSNVSNPNAVVIGGFDAGLTGFSTTTQLGTLTIQYTSGTRGAQLIFSDVSVGESNTANLALAVIEEITTVNGRYSLPDDGSATTPLTVTRSTIEAGNAITAADALAALRIAVGLNPNSDPDGSGPLQAPRPSPYQVIAADVNGSGTVTAADALAILRMAVKLPDALPNGWFFVEEARDFWNETTQQYTLNRTSANWDRAITVDANDQAALGLVGILKADVNGSWIAPAGSSDLDLVDPNYFANLAARLSVPSDQWGL